METRSAVEARATAWSRYWRSGARHSCVGSFKDHYGEATQRFWRERFARVVDSDSVLELGCGNGSLLQWFAQVGVRWPESIDAVDLAELDQSWLMQLPLALRSRVHLHPRTPATHLPSADASITQIWSQYALEYFADEACWRSLARVLAPRAALSAIIHHRDSRLCRLAEAESADCRWLLIEDGPLDRAEQMLQWLAMSVDANSRARRDADPRSAAAREQFNQSYSAVAERIAASAFPDLLRDTAECVMQILRATPASGESAARQALAALRADLSDNRLRVAELVSCALDRVGIEGWAQRLRTSGFATIEIGEVVEQGHLFGWRFVAERT